MCFAITSISFVSIPSCHDDRLTEHGVDGVRRMVLENVAGVYWHKLVRVLEALEVCVENVASVVRTQTTLSTVKLLS